MAQSIQMGYLPLGPILLFQFLFSKTLAVAVETRNHILKESKNPKQKHITEVFNFVFVI